MLTSDLVRAKVTGKRIVPSLIDTERPLFRQTAEALVELVREGALAACSRGSLDEGVAELVSDHREHKVLRGLAKLAMDRCTFAVQAPISPSELRAQVFRAARVRGPLTLAKGPFGHPTAADVLAEVGAEHGIDADAMRAALYADLKQEQRLTEARVPNADWLLRRYNVALAQALLLRATEVRVVLHDPPAPRMRQLFRWVKFHQLTHRARRDGDRLILVLDGPMSMFRLSTRYGMQLANFLPALLLHEGAWQLEATVLWTRAQHQKQLALTHEDGLVSHYPDTGAWRSREHAHFAKRFEATKSAWALSEGKVPVQLGPTDMIFPDFTLTRGRQQVHLEIVGFWRRETLERRVRALADHAPTNLVLAVSRKLRGSADELGDINGQVVQFSDVLSPSKVIAAADACAPEPAS